MKSKVSKPFLVSFIYKPPNSKYEWNENFVRHVKRCYGYCIDVIILGDFNIDLLDISVRETEMDSNSPRHCQPYPVDFYCD